MATGDRGILPRPPVQGELVSRPTQHTLRHPIMHRGNLMLRAGVLLLAISATVSTAFCPTICTKASQTSTRHLPTPASEKGIQLSMVYHSRDGRSRNGKTRSKRQERVGHLVQGELSSILHRGNIKGDAEYLGADLRQRISIISVDVSPDLRQARVTVSIRKKGPKDGEEEDGSGNPVVDRRRAYSWLVQNTKPIRHTLAQRMSHMKSVPDLTFAQADVSAAVDVMYLIDKVSTGYKREGIGAFGGDDGSLPRGLVKGIDFDEEDDNIEFNEGFFLEDSANE